MSTDKEYRRPGWEWIDQPLYDYVNLHNEPSTPIALFTVPLGPRKTLADTNMVFSNHLPNDVEFLIQRVKLLTSGDEDAIMNIVWKGSIQIVIGQSEYLTLPLLRLAADPYELSAKLLIVEHQNFRVYLNTPLVNPPLKARVGIELRGMMYRRYK